MKGELTISRQTSSHEGDCMCIRINDATSGLRIVNIKLDLETFAKVITGMSSQNAIIEYVMDEVDAGRMGFRKEMNHLNVNTSGIKGSVRDNMDALYALIAPHLVDGWELWSDGIGTQQHGIDRHKISLCRYVKED